MSVISSVAAPADSQSALPVSTESLPRRALKGTVCALCTEIGFTDGDEITVETLTEMLQSFMTELCRSTKAYSELAGRTDPLVTDVVIALIEMGQKVDTLPAYAMRHGRLQLPAPSITLPAPEARRLQVGQRRAHKSNVMDYMPPFPDPHTYIKSSTYKAPCSEYQAIREKAAAQKRDIERALTKFIAKTGDTENLFSDDPYAFPLIANKPKPLPYMEALMPKDLDLELSAQDDEDKPTNQQLPQQQQEEENNVGVKVDRQDSSGGIVAGGGKVVGESSVGQNAENLVDPEIDNPYLRPIRMPKIKTTTSSKKYK